MEEMEARHRQDREADPERHQQDLECSRKELQDRFARLKELVSEGVRRRDIRLASSSTPHYDMGYQQSSQIGVNIRKDVYIPQVPTPVDLNYSHKLDEDFVVQFDNDCLDGYGSVGGHHDMAFLIS
ncbi:hypothetical protein Scep_007023 [Stephania cephalantha]|uniref:Uncharacterized protein n=1 Tax=Stephania cephalantha TaxID=152367 RepID=A0AAP0K923_9MAGN